MTHKPQALAFKRSDVNFLLEDLKHLMLPGGVYVLDQEGKEDFAQWCDVHELLAWFGPRSHIEGDANFLQVIPYGVIRDPWSNILGYNRAAGAGEQRLAGRFSIGFGGHVEIKDWRPDLTLPNALALTLEREIAEEVELTWRTYGGVMELYHPEIAILDAPIAIVLDPTTDVGRCHLGVVYQIDIARSHWGDNANLVAESGEHDQIVAPRWLTPDEAMEEANPEDWTRLLLQHHFIFT